MLLFLFYFVVVMSVKDTIEVVKYQNHFKSEWDVFVSEAKNGTFLFKRNFMEYHKDRFQDFSLMFYTNNLLVAILPACSSSTVCYSHKGLTYGGLLVRSDCKFQLYKEVFIALLQFLQLNKFSELVIKTLPSIFCESGNDELHFLHQFYGSRQTLNIGSVIYKNKDIHFSKSVVRNANNARKKGVEVRKSDDFKSFWTDLLIPRLHERYNKKPVHSLQEILYLKKLFPDEIVLYAAYLDEEMIAGTILFKQNNYIKSQYIASKDEFNKLGGLDLLHYELIQNLNFDFFDFGTSTKENSNEEQSNLLAWKEQFGARTIVYPTFTFII